MKKYLISTLTAAAAMAVPAFSADGDLIASWDFSSASLSDGKIYATDGSSFYISTASGDSLSNGILTIVPKESDKTTIDVSSANVTLSEGISIVMTITGWSTNSGGGILASIETDNQSDGGYAAAIGESGNGSGTRSGFFAADGSATCVTSEQYEALTYDTSWNNPVTVAMTFVGDYLCLYELKDGEYVLIADATINSGSYDNIVGNIKEVALGSWDSTLNGSAVNNMTISSVEIYSGDIMAAPEPSMFGLMFGLGTIGLVATRRRKRA